MSTIIGIASFSQTYGKKVGDFMQRLVIWVLAWTVMDVTLLLHTPAVHTATACDPPIAKRFSVQASESSPKAQRLFSRVPQSFEINTALVVKNLSG